MGYFCALVISMLIVVRASQCPKDEGKRILIEELLVKENPTNLIQDSKFFDVWVNKHIKDKYVCSRVVYTKKADDSIEVVIFSEEIKDLFHDEDKEFMTETDKIGLYLMKHSDDKVTEGYRYILYADKHAIAFVDCCVDDSCWQMRVQVKSDGQAKLSAKVGDVEVSDSIERAHQKLADAANKLNIQEKLVMYDLDKLC